MSRATEALYYPSVEIRNETWLRYASLFWDCIYRIVPNGYEPKDSDFVKGLVSEGIVQNLWINKIDEVLKTTASKFERLLNSGRWAAAALNPFMDHSGAYRRLHKDKVDVQLRSILIEKYFGGKELVGDYFPVSGEFSALYMAFLANEVISMLSGDGLGSFPVITDDPALWTGNIYYSYEPERFNANFYIDAQKFALIMLRMELPVFDFLPENINISEYRENFQELFDTQLKCIDEVYRNIDLGKYKTMNRSSSDLPRQRLANQIDTVKKKMDKELQKSGKSQTVMMTYGVPINQNQDENIWEANRQLQHYNAAIVETDFITATKAVTSSRNVPSSVYVQSSFLVDVFPESLELDFEAAAKRISTSLEQFIYD